MTAAHCFDDLVKKENYEVSSKILYFIIHYKRIKIFQRRTITIRDKTSNKETVEFKRHYVYPFREDLYDDIAVVELGRRIPENYEKV